MKKLITSLCFLLLGFFYLSAQPSKSPINIGYFMPYGINAGLKIGTSFEVKTWQSKTNDKWKTLAISPQIGFWSYSVYSNNIHRTLVFGTDLDYKRYTSSGKSYGLASVGLNYHLSLVS